MVRLEPLSHHQATPDAVTPESVTPALPDGTHAIVITASAAAFVTLDDSTPSSTNGIRIAAGVPVFLPVAPKAVKALGNGGAAIVDVLALGA